jgi:hypothetical protein
MRHGRAHRHANERRDPRFLGSSSTRAARAGLVLGALVVVGAGCHVGAARPPLEAPRIDAPFAKAVDAYGAEIRRLPGKGAFARADLARALDKLAEAVATIPDARAGDEPRAAAEQIHAAARRIEIGRGDPTIAEIDSGLAITSALLSKLARVPYGDAPGIAAHARALALAVMHVERAASITDARLAVRVALEQARATLVAVGAAATKSPYPSRNEPRVAGR